MRKMLDDNDGVHIKHIVDTTTCKKHAASEGMACWSVWIALTKVYAPAVCGSRIRRAGFAGKISPASLSQKVSGGRSKTVSHKSRY